MQPSGAATAPQTGRTPPPSSPPASFLPPHSSSSFHLSFRVLGLFIWTHQPPFLPHPYFSVKPFTLIRSQHSPTLRHIVINFIQLALFYPTFSSFKTMYVYVCVCVCARTDMRVCSYRHVNYKSPAREERRETLASHKPEYIAVQRQ